MPNANSLLSLDARPLRLGSRRSELALRQTHMVRDALEARGLTTEVVTFSTSGDERLDVPLPAIGGKGVFTAELETALLAGDVDLCVHSLKDLPTVSPEGLDIGAVLPREDPRDVLLVRADVATHARTLDQLPEGARVGTSSLRRAAMLRIRRPGLAIVDLRGNVPTRVRKLDDGMMEACILAGAGIRRLGMEGRVTEWLATPGWLPAPAQGVIAVQIRRDDDRIRDLLSHVHDAAAWTAATAERAFLHALEGGCQLPVAALATHKGPTLWLEGVILDGAGAGEVRGGLAIASPGHAEAAGEELAASLLARGGAALLARSREATAGVVES